MNNTTAIQATKAWQTPAKKNKEKSQEARAWRIVAVVRRAGVQLCTIIGKQ